MKIRVTVLFTLLVNGVPIFHSAAVVLPKKCFCQRLEVSSAHVLSSAPLAKTTSTLAMVHAQSHTKGQPAKAWRWAVGREDLHKPTMQLFVLPTSE